MEKNIKEGGKKEIKISKSEEEDDSKEKNKIEKNNSYSKIANVSHDSTENDIQIEIENDIFNYYNNENDKENEITQSQIDYLNKIREEAQMRSERYSELSSNSNILKKLNNNQNSKVSNNNNENNNNTSNYDTNDTISNYSHNILNNDFEENPNNEINPNLDRVYNKIHPFLFINNEPLILIGPDTLYYIIIFSISSFLSFIFYSLKSRSYFIMKFLFLFGYLFYTITYSLLMLLNPGIPTNKGNIDLDELKRNYNQCSICNCIFYKNNDYITFHCTECNICVENFDHHCSFASKCIGKKNKLIFKLWLFSIPCYILIIFFYIIL